MAEIVLFGQWLKRRRQQLDLTQKALAQRAGCALGTIRKFEADERRPSRQLATLLARHLEIGSDQVEAFIAFARAEPYSSDARFHFLALTNDEAPVTAGQRPSPPDHPTVHNNLPAETTRFIGRDAELATLGNLLSDPDVRLVTIVGPGGIGKTRLALAWASQQIDGVSPASQVPYPQGIFFVDLAPLSEPDRLLMTLVETLDLRLQGGEQERRSPKQQFLDYLKNRKLLLLLDNFEHLLDSSSPPETSGAAALVTEILENAPQVRMLVTSRERLNLPMEQLFRIEGLTFPEEQSVVADGKPEDIDSFTARYAALQLFLQAARRNKSNFAVESSAELVALVRICRLVGGMPLALELAGSWVDVLSVMDIATELQQGLDILETEQRHVLDRQRSVQATFDYSWRRLDEKEQTIFAQLSVFRGGFTRAAAQAVTGATLRQLYRLVNKSFIRYSKRSDRYQVHELLRQYGADKLGRDAELEKGVKDRHCSYYCQALGKLTNAQKSAGQLQAIAAIEADIDNVRLAWNHAVTRQDLQAINISAESLHRFYWNTSRAMQGIKEFETAVAKLQSGEPIGKRGVVMGRLLAFLGRFYSETGQFAIATETLKESVDLVQWLGTREETLIPILFLASHLLFSDESREEAKRLFAKGLDIAREMGDQWAIGHVFITTAVDYHLRGDYEQADRRSREALNQFRQIGDIGGTYFSLAYLSLVAADRGRNEEARSLGQETMALIREFSHSILHTAGLAHLAMTMLTIGEYGEAEKLFQQQQLFYREVGDRYWASYLLFRLGEVAFSTGDYALATQRYQESLAGALEFWGPEDSGPKPGRTG